MSITFDPNGGDLGRANFKSTHPLEFHTILPHIAEILEYLHISKLSTLPFKYAFEFHSYHRNQILLEMSTITLPHHVSFYEIDGNKLFEIRGQSGGVISGLICYLVTGEK